MECLNHKFVYESAVETSRLVNDLADSAYSPLARAWTDQGVGLLSACCRAPEVHAVLRAAAVRRGPAGRWLRRASRAPCRLAPRLLPLLAAQIEFRSPQEVSGPHLFETQPSGNYFEYKAMAIGARSQAAKTYLEGRFPKDAAAGAPGGFDHCARARGSAGVGLRRSPPLPVARRLPSGSKDELIQHALRALAACVQGDEALNVENTSLAVVGKGVAFSMLGEEELRSAVCQGCTQARAMSTSLFTPPNPTPPPDRDPRGERCRR